VLHVLLPAWGRRPARTSFGFLIWALPVVVQASKCGVCCLSHVGPRICWRVGGTGEMLVEALFPQGGGCIELACSSGWSRVLRIDPVGGPPHCDFADQGDARVASRCSPGLRAVALVGLVLDLVGEVDDQLGSIKRLPQRKHQSLARDPWSCSGFRCAVNTGSPHSVCALLLPKWSEARRRNSKLYWLGHSCSEPIRLA
jgi:hypothetical protein